LPMDGVKPSLENVKNSTYPLSRELNLVIKGEPSPLASRFIDYARSTKVTSLVNGQQLIPVVPGG
jgi:phosphate transport system substrate-binding protein